MFRVAASRRTLGLHGHGTRLYSTPIATTVSADGSNVKPGTYSGPLTTTFRRLKIFSLASLGLTTTLVPCMFIVDSALPMLPRTMLAAAALATSGSSTAIIGWCGAPYVSTMRQVEAGAALEMETKTLLLRPRITTVWDAQRFLKETNRPFAKWELARQVTLNKNDAPPLQEQETVAETKDDKGQVVGRWIVDWKQHEGGWVGDCRPRGKIVRHFNVDEELFRRSL